MARQGSPERGDQVEKLVKSKPIYRESTRKTDVFRENYGVFVNYFGNSFY
jgi:hypothetical protein